MFGLTPTEPYKSSQRYLNGTNVLQTQFSTTTGTCRTTDFMPLYSRLDGTLTELHQIVRHVQCIQGQMQLSVSFVPRPDYGRAEIALHVEESQVTCHWRDGALTLTTPTKLHPSGSEASGQFKLKAKQEAVFVLTYSDSSSPGYDDNLTPTDRQDATVAFWRNIAADSAYQGPWREEVERSYLALHLLNYVASGAIVAAPTTSLPEAIGGVRNWDYRYTWLRDAAFTVEALMSLGHLEEASRFFMWLERICARDGVGLGTMYKVDGERDLQEAELTHLRGYRDSQPVRIGNDAAYLVQLDIYGEVLGSAAELAKVGVPPSDGQWELLRTLANLAAARWKEPDSGIWEVRGGPYHFVYSKVMCWVALDKAVRLAQDTGRADAETEAWKRELLAVKEEVLTKGWSERKQAFVQHYETDAMDASNLLIPLMGFLPADDPRVVSTVERIQAELGYGPFLYRYKTDETDDGLVGTEGAFTLCSFWLVRVLAQMGRAEEAQILFEQLLTVASPLGLYAEMVDPQSKEALGNYPQAFTHIGLILAVQALRQNHTALEEMP